jgi:hypothetical protein
LRLKVHAPVPNSIRTREEKILARFPKSSSLLNSVRSRTDRYKFGISDREVNKFYRFSDYKNSESFFAHKFRQFGKNYIDKTDVEIDIANSVNTIGPGTESLPPADRFIGLAKKFSGELLQARQLKTPYVSILTGPTGSGKTAYSKCLFSSGAQVFWANGIIPSRVEFTKFFKAGQELSSQQILDAIHQCQTRDLLIYLCFSEVGVPSKDALEGILSSHGEYREHHNKIRGMVALAEGKKIDGSSFTLSEAHNIWKEQVGYFPEEVCRNILGKIKSPSFHIQFLVSLDGFDALKTKDFLISDRYHGPISAVADLLSDALNQVARYGGTPSSHNTNLVVFMRDTTYARIRLELNLTPNGERRIPVRWIVPPPYKILAETIVSAVDGDVSSSVGQEGLDSFVVNVRKNLINVLKGTSVGLSINQPISSAFSWNARHMKRHIRRICIWSLENYLISHGDQLDERQKSAGLSEAWLWEKTINNRALKDMAAYSVLEAFFLDDTKCLQSKFRLNSREISNFLEGSDLVSALAAIDERPELEGLFDSIFNYMTKGLDESEGKCYPHTLVFVRILQILKFDPGITIEDLHDEISCFYDNISLEELRFYTICLCENEYVVFEGVENSASLDECRFFVSNFGFILLNKVIYSVSYFSQSLMISELIRSGFGTHFRERNFRTNEDWIANCVFNSIIAYNIVQDAEIGERKCRQSAGKDFEKFSLCKRLRESLIWEAQRIFSRRRFSGNLEWHFNNIPEKLKPLLGEFPNFDTLEEIWK